MRLESFFKKFELFVAAPNSVKKYRELIVDLGVAGKLVNHDHEEPPVDLGLSGNSDSELTMPHNWTAGLLGEAFVLEYGNNLPKAKRSETGEYPVYGSNGVVGTHNSFLIKEPALIVGRKGSAGALNIAEGPSWTTDVAYYVRPSKAIDLRFSYYLFRSLRLDQLGKGIKPGLSRKEAYALPIALPPLAEQKRIVAKLDALMGWCDRLEALQAERDTQHAALARAALARFADDPTPQTLEYLFHEDFPIDPADFRKSILTMAVQGKLIQQDAKAFEADLESREYDSKGKPPPYANPLNWKWASLVEATSDIVDCPHSTPKWQDQGVICVRTTEFNPGYLDLTHAKRVSEETYIERTKRLAPKPKDLLFCREGKVGSACLIPPDTKLCLGQRMMLIRAKSCVDPKYLEHVLNSPLSLTRIESLITGMTAPRVNVKAVKDFWIPVPPLAEQRRIVAKVEELMVLVDQLEEKQQQAHDLGQRLIDAAVAELTSAEETVSL